MIRAKEHVTPMQLDVIKEGINIGVGRAAETLNQMTGSHVVLEVPKVSVATLPEVMAEYTANADTMVSVVKLGFDGHFSGLSVMLFDPEEATKLVSILIGEELPSEALDMLRAGTLQEVGNVVLNGVMGSIANMLDSHFTYTPPDHFETLFNKLLAHVVDKDSVILIAETGFFLESHMIQGQVYILFNSQSFSRLLATVDKLVQRIGILGD